MAKSRLERKRLAAMAPQERREEREGQREMDAQCVFLNRNLAIIAKTLRATIKKIDPIYNRMVKYIADTCGEDYNDDEGTHEVLAAIKKWLPDTKRRARRRAA